MCHLLLIANIKKIYKLSTLYFYLPLVHLLVRNYFSQACQFYCFHKCDFISLQQFCPVILWKFHLKFLVSKKYLQESIFNPYRCKKPLRVASRIRVNYVDTEYHDS